MHDAEAKPPSPQANAPSLTGTQKRTLAVLLVSQIFSGVGLAAGVTVGALLVQDMLRSTALAGLPSALLTAGSAVAAVSIGRISHALGRRPGLAAGYLAGALGGAGVVAAASLDLPALLVISLVLYGAGTAANLQARYAGADLAAARNRARAVSTVLVATTLGGVVGPNLAAPAGHLATALGLPPLTGLFLVSGAAFAVAALILIVWLRPDPLVLARSLADEPEDAPRVGSGAVPEDSKHAERRHPGLWLGVLVMVLGQLVMVAIMTMTPVHMQDHGHSAAASGLVIALHVGAMYLPSPLAGTLSDRCGPKRVVIASGLVLLAAGVIAAASPDDSVVLLAVALVLLGVGWNFGLVSGTTILTNAVPVTTRAKTQGVVDVAVAVAGATGGMASGVVVAAASYPLLALTGAALALVVPAAIAISARRALPGDRAGRP
ncbi:MFS transporter [Saccharopolyspora griseoalba]|uniref:MFS transporter n=1 Tax=Saccharopolyspora griseoalba TaxID=1431848 RepID=A0ABW2LS01_9PSEU